MGIELRMHCALHAFHATFLAGSIIYEISCAPLLLWFVCIAQASMMCNDPSQPSTLCLPALQLIVNRSSLKQPCLQQQRILGLPDAWHHSVHYKAAFCINNTYTLALAAGHMPALHVKINSLQFPSSKDKL